jgi:hypothetical protein
VKKHILVIGIIFLFVGLGFQPAFANDMSIDIEKKHPLGGTFMRTFGGMTYDYGNCVQQTKDGGYIIVGETESFGADGRDVWLIKTNNNGNMVWSRRFGGSKGDAGYSVRQTTDGGYIIAGTKESDFYKYGNIWLIKTDSRGNKVWDKTFGGSDWDWSNCVQQTTDGGYIIIGETYSWGTGEIHGWLIKTNNDGNKEWDRFFNGKPGKFVQQTIDDGYIIIVGKRLVKFDNDGNKIWDKKFESSGNCVQQTTDEGYIITGVVELDFFDYDVWLVKTDKDGNKIWNKTFGGGFRDYGGCVQQTSDGGYIIVGTSNSFDFGSPDVWLIKVDSNGNMVWNRTFGAGRFFAFEVGRYVQQTTDGGYIIVGDKGITYTEICNIWLIKTDEYGKSKTKAVTDNILLQRLLERFPLLERLYYLFRM